MDWIHVLRGLKFQNLETTVFYRDIDVICTSPPPQNKNPV